MILLKAVLFTVVQLSVCDFMSSGCRLLTCGTAKTLILLVLLKVARELEARGKRCPELGTIRICTCRIPVNLKDFHAVNALMNILASSRKGLPSGRATPSKMVWM